MEVFTSVVLKDRITIRPHQLNTRLNDCIISLIKKKIEGKCSKHGYIKSGSTAIISKTSGTIVSGFLNGYTSFDVTFRAEVCNPQIGYIFKATIVNTNKFGVLAEAFVDKKPVIEVIIAKKNNQAAFENLVIGQDIQVKVLGKKFQLNDTRVVVVAKLVVDVADGHGHTINDDIEDVVSEGEYGDDLEDIVGTLSDDDDTNASEKTEQEESDEESEEEDEEEVVVGAKVRGVKIGEEIGEGEEIEEEEGIEEDDVEDDNVGDDNNSVVDEDDD